MVSEGPQFGILRLFPSTAFDCFPELLFFPVFHTLSCHEAELRDTPWASFYQPVKWGGETRCSLRLFLAPTLPDAAQYLLASRPGAFRNPGWCVSCSHAESSWLPPLSVGTGAHPALVCIRRGTFGGSGSTYLTFRDVVPLSGVLPI